MSWKSIHVLCWLSCCPAGHLIMTRAYWQKLRTPDVFALNLLGNHFITKMCNFLINILEHKIDNRLWLRQDTSRHWWNITLWSPVAVGWHWVCKTQLQSKLLAPAHICPAAFSAASPSQSISAGSACWSTTDWSMLSNKQRKKAQTLHLNYAVIREILGQLVNLADQFRLECRLTKTYILKLRTVIFNCLKEMSHMPLVCLLFTQYSKHM